MRQGVKVAAGRAERVARPRIGRKRNFRTGASRYAIDSDAVDRLRMRSYVKREPRDATREAGTRELATEVSVFFRFYLFRVWLFQGQSENIYFV